MLKTKIIFFKVFYDSVTNFSASNFKVLSDVCPRENEKNDRYGFDFL